MGKNKHTPTNREPGVFYITDVIVVNDGTLDERRRDFRADGISDDEPKLTMSGMLLAHPSNPALALASEMSVVLFGGMGSQVVMSEEQGNSGVEIAEALDDEDISKQLILGACKNIYQQDLDH